MPHAHPVQPYVPAQLPMQSAKLKVGLFASSTAASDPPL
jgi:hypothetical protein